MPNVAAILLGRVDLRVDRQQFRNNIKIQDSLSAVSHASHSRSGTGRHGGRPSQEQEANIPAVPDDTEVIPPKCPEANAAAVPDDTEVIPPKCQKRISQRYRTTRRSSLPNARSECRSGTGRHGGHPSQMPEANIVAVPDDTEVVPPKCQKQMPQRYRTTRRSSLPNARSEYRSERVDLAISSHCMILASIRTPSRYQVYSTV